jgi:serine phosphatase RsbU (regulator of sigma subunit)
MNPFTNIEMPLQKGDCIYVFSDGFQDQMGGPDCRKFMRKNLRELLVSIHQKQFAEQREILDNTIENWRKHPAQPKGETAQMDDILVIGLRV